MSNKLLLIFILFAVPYISGFGQVITPTDVNDSVPLTTSEIPLPSDSVTLLPDSTQVPIIADSISQPPKKSSTQLDAQVIYSAQDSIVFWSNGTGFLHGDGDVKYNEITLKSAYIRVKMDSSLLYARGVVDSVGDVIGEPIFGDGKSEYNSKEITYNLQTGKGYVLSALTQQGEAYIVSERTKKTGEDLIDVAGAKFTTCDDHDHPHFYIRIKEGKVKPGSHIVSGPAQVYLADVPLPIMVPFGFFPFTDQYSSGIIMPSVADELNRGLGLINGGYYFAINDYVDLQLLGEIYTKGTWGVSAVSNYLKKYKYTGNFNFNYREDVTGDKDLPDYQKNKNMNITWTHSQDAKANPYRTFSASVNFSTSGYDRNNINNYSNLEISSQNEKRSSINFSQKFAKAPLLNISGSVMVAQYTRDSTISLELPNLSLSYSRFYPLKRKNPIGKERWYEKISMSYSGSLKNSIRTKENQLFSSNYMRDWKSGFTHTIPIEASFNLLNYITVTPSFRYTERWNLSSVRRNWDANAQTEMIDTLTGFHRNFNFDASISMQTKLYGYYTPIRAIFGDKIEAIRHVLTPNVSFSYNPDFSDPKWGFYDQYVRTDIYGRMDTVKYGIYNGMGVGGPSEGRSGSINFSLSNNVEMKIRNDRDTTGREPFKKISLIDELYIGSAYNFMKDSLNLSDFSVRLRLKLGKNKTISLQTSFDPYMLKKSGNSANKVNEFTWNNGMFPRFTGTSTSYSMNLNNATFTKISQWLKGEGSLSESSDNSDFSSEIVGIDESQEQKKEEKTSSKKKKKDDLDTDGYIKIKVPWNISLTYSVRYYPNTSEFIERKEKDGYGRYKMKLTHDLSISGNISLAENWKINASLYYDITEKKVNATSFNVTRNLHCWSMTARIVPFGTYKSYHFHIGVNASMLKDLKYEKHNDQSAANIQWY